MKKILLLLLIPLFCLTSLYLYFYQCNCEHPQSSFERITNAHYARKVRNADDESALFLGSSSIQALDVSRVVNRALNLGIGGETLADLEARLESYELVDQYQLVVLGAGFNDLCNSDFEYKAEKFKNIMRVFEASPMVISSLQPSPTTRLCKDLTSRISQYNDFLQMTCKSRDKCKFVDLEAAFLLNTSQYFEKDGIHLNPLGYRVWEEELRNAISKLSGDVSR
ncbi:hypothetical protein ISG33_01940 [Glaciecola sp. MH2013]|uniref:GDSL-type esterase/lipase family protein n=1 Tax=Glaciecola sp. MH2013 TaxID=2785524 RepID=UPI0018A027A7|nr:GDSL-type esterase/lipase family protein [Glaciecola sp. MH2013]MBF7072162.1 hypothetical protein [Glaciecola sp. MH2013]